MYEVLGLSSIHHSDRNGATFRSRRAFARQSQGVCFGTAVLVTSSSEEARNAVYMNRTLNPGKDKKVQEKALTNTPDE